MKQADDNELILRIRAMLDAGVSELESGIDQRLQRMRHQALARYPAEVAMDDAQRLRLQLDAGLQDLPAPITHRLDQIRQQALQRRRRQSLLGSLPERLLEFLNFRFAVPAGAFATAVVLVTGLSLFYRGPGPGEPFAVDEEIVLLASADDFELYENLDFYLWLADNGMPN